MFAVEILGRELPAPGIGIAFVVFAAAFFMMSRNTGGFGYTGNRVGRGMMHRCERCGVNFQPEQVELLSNGETRHWIDERCPNCGWELDWGSPHKPGGSSGRW